MRTITFNISVMVNNNRATTKKTAKAKKKAKTVRKKLSVEEIEKRNHRNEVRGVFGKSGFDRISGIADKGFTFKGRTGDLDDIFIYENVILLLEYTCSKSDNISSHLLKKKVLFDHILNNSQEFIAFLDTIFPVFKENRNDFYDVEQCKVVILYCSKNNVDQRLKDQLQNIVFFDYQIVKYFASVADAVKHSTKYELFKFLKLNYGDIGTNSVSSIFSRHVVNGSILPESHSNFQKGYKVVSFYLDPESLLKKSYVLRKDSWRDEGGLYQRMIIKNKIRLIRKHLLSKKRVFINNIIVTLPSETRLLDNKGNAIDPSNLQKTEPAVIQIPDGFNVIGLIDGQHRVYAYHEGGDHDDEIQKLRRKQNLLVTGIIYPENINDIEKSKFEATLFLEINSNQANAKSDLKQAIGLILNPFSSESIAKAIIHRLNTIGPLQDMFERPFFTHEKIKTTSIVSYGLKPIVKLSGTDSFFFLWKEVKKENLLHADDRDLLNGYIDFCVSELNNFFVAVKKMVDKNKWTLGRKAEQSILSTSTVIGLIICIRLLIENRKTGDVAYYESCFQKLNEFNFTSYPSSQYGAMGRDIYNTFFNNGTLH